MGVTGLTGFLEQVAGLLLAALSGGRQLHLRLLEPGEGLPCLRLGLRQLQADKAQEDGPELSLATDGIRGGSDPARGSEIAGWEPPLREGSDPDLILQARATFKGKHNAGCDHGVKRHVKGKPEPQESA